MTVHVVCYRIADGTRNAQEVLAEQLRNYRAVFERALEQVLFLSSFSDCFVQIIID